MNIDFMRKVDYWCGVPLTAAATLILRARDMMLGSPPSALLAKRVLFIELSEMGSAIIADPALKRVAGRGLDAQERELYFVIFKKNAASLGIFGTVRTDRIFLIRENSFATLAWDTLRFFAWCRRERIDAVIDLELFSRFTALLSAFSGARRRIGFFNPRSEGLYRGDLLTNPISYNPHVHIAKNFIALTEPLFVDWDAKDPLVRRAIGDDEIRLKHVQPAPAAQERVRLLVEARLRGSVGALVDLTGKRYLLVNVNAGDFLPQRRWPKESFAAFVKLILAHDSDLIVLMTGSPAERASVSEVEAQVGDARCANIAGDVEFNDLPALYSISAAILTNDSGPAHFASAVGLRTFVLFGPETPALYGPLRNATSIYAGLACSPCVYATNHRNTPCNDNQCLKQISPKFVYEQVRSALDESAAGARIPEVAHSIARCAP